MKNNILQQVMKNAWQLKKTAEIMHGKGIMFAECLKMSWAQLYKTPQLVDLMHDRVVKFTFLKVDGSTRLAFGTLNAAYLPDTQQNTQSTRRQNEQLQVYYDIEKQGFRCFYKQNLLSIEEIL